MGILILIGYEFLTVMFPALTVMAFCMRKEMRRGKNHWYFLFIMIFTVYMFGVFHFTGAGTIYDLKRYGLEFRAEQWNFVPFSDEDMNVVEHVLNILLFVPLGFLLPCIWAGYGKFSHVCIFGGFLSALIEASQLLNHRRTDIDDLILNVLGTAVGFCIFRIYARVTKRGPGLVRHCRYEAVIYIVSMYLCRFFVFHELGMAKLLYGF